MTMVMKCRADNGFGGRCPAVAVGSNHRCLDHMGSPEPPDCPPPDKIIFRFDGVSEEALAAARIPIVERTAAREDEMARVREDVVAMQGGPYPQNGLKPKTGINPFGVPIQGLILTGRVDGAVAEIMRQGFRLVDAHGLWEDRKRGNQFVPTLVFVATLAKTGVDRDRALEVLALVAAEAAATRCFFVCVNPPMLDRMTGRMAVVHTMNCRKAQVGQPAKVAFVFANGFWGLEEVAPAPICK